MDNWFSLGEEVGVVTENYPEVNGDYKIIGKLSREEAAQRIGCIEFIKLFTSDEYYILEGLSFSDKNRPSVVYDFVSLRALRKKHKGSGMQFNEMIKALNTTIVEWA